MYDHKFNKGYKELVEATEAVLAEKQKAVVILEAGFDDPILKYSIVKDKAIKMRISKLYENMSNTTVKDMKRSSSIISNLANDYNTMAKNIGLESIYEVDKGNEPTVDWGERTLDMLLTVNPVRGDSDANSKFDAFIERITRHNKGKRIYMQSVKRPTDL